MGQATGPAVLIVEDDQHALSGYVEYLSTAGYDVTGVGDGNAGLIAALGRPPEVVITDITLPGMSGFELAAALRQDPRTRGTPVIGMTAHWTREVHARATDVNMAAVLLKPCAPAHLAAELSRVLGVVRRAPLAKGQPDRSVRPSRDV
jgi:CheY-like chemotaxis protein